MSLFALRALPPFVAAMALAHAACAGSYVYTAISVPGSDATFPSAINNLGEVVGSYLMNQDRTEGGFVWKSGALQQLAIGDTTLLMGINSAGIVVGSNSRDHSFDALIYRSDEGRVIRPLRNQSPPASALLTGINNSNTSVGYYGTGLQTTGFMLHDGVLTQVHAPDGSPTELLGIDNDGVGYGQELRHFRWFEYRGGTVKFLPLPAASVVSGIGENGKLAGSLAYPNDPPGSRAFIWDGGAPLTFRWRGTLGGHTVRADFSEAIASTPNGVFGNYGFATGGSPSNGFVKRGTTFYTLNPPGATYTRISAVNADGTFVGFYDTGPFGAYKEHGFIATCPADQQPCTR